MRWLFLFVLSVNLAYIAWQFNTQPTAAYSAVPPLKNVTPIILLAELDQQSESLTRHIDLDEDVYSGEKSDLEVSSENADEGENDVQLSAVEFVDVVEGSAEKESVVQVQSQQEIVQQPIEQGPEEQEPEMEKDAVHEDEKQVEVLQKDISAKNSDAETTEDAQVKEDSCYTLGPFRDLDQLRVLTQEIKSFVISAGFRGSEKKEKDLYWINIKPAKNRQQAIATGERLKKKKIKDFYIIREGENLNGISLGYYKNEKGARGLLKKVKKLGFDVEMETVFKTFTVYWLDFRLAPDVNIPESVFSKYIAMAGKDDVTRVSSMCAEQM